MPAYFLFYLFLFFYYIIFLLLFLGWVWPSPYRAGLNPACLARSLVQANDPAGQRNKRALIHRCCYSVQANFNSLEQCNVNYLENEEKREEKDCLPGLLEAMKTMVMLMLVSVFSACVFPFVFLVFLFEFLPLLLALFVVPGS
jgi:hypothetical protein